MQNGLYALIFSWLADSFENAYQLANLYHLAAGKNLNTIWPVSHTVKKSTSWQKFYQLSDEMEKSTWLVKNVIWLVVEVKLEYWLFTNQLHDILFQIV